MKIALAHNGIKVKVLDNPGDARPIQFSVGSVRTWVTRKQAEELARILLLALDATRNQDRIGGHV